MRLPPIDAIREAARVAGVCVRPLVAQVTDVESGETRMVAMACKSTREAQCPPCAESARRLRIQQCREGWHLTEEPEPATTDDDEESGEVEQLAERGRRVRSTRRRQDVADLPTVPMEDRTVGRVFFGPNGQRYRPSMFLTLTLDSYGRVDGEGVPVDPDRYDYRRAALDAIHFAKLVDRFWQNLRRCVGFNVQYFAAVEAQRRGAPHLHAAARGSFARQVVRQVAAATYHQVWWPAHDDPVYVDRVPVWAAAGYVDPDTGEVLPTWGDALDTLGADADAEPAHVIRFGRQVDMQGLLAGTPKADRAIGYLCKYLPKDIASTFDRDDDPSPARSAHLDRLADEVRWLPCSETCANWLRYGVQPEGAGPGLVPGHCAGKAHDRENLGYGGRRVLVSCQWTGKTLGQHRADRVAVVEAVLVEAGVDVDDHQALAVATTEGRYQWETLGRSAIDDATYAATIAHAVRQRQKWRAQYEAAKARAGPGPPVAYSREFASEQGGQQ
ncbi:MAG: replication initiator [Acidimicrobiales bacterium]